MRLARALAEHAQRGTCLGERVQRVGQVKGQVMAHCRLAAVAHRLEYGGKACTAQGAGVT